MGSKVNSDLWVFGEATFEIYSELGSEVIHYDPKKEPPIKDITKRHLKNGR